MEETYILFLLPKCTEPYYNVLKITRGLVWWGAASSKRTLIVFKEWTHILKVKLRSFLNE